MSRRINAPLGIFVPARSLAVSQFALILLLAILACGTPLTGASYAAEKASLLAARESISSAELRQFVNVLADDTFEGREAGSRGGHAAGGYLEDHFKKHGLRPAGTTGFYQLFSGGSRNILGLWEGSDPELKKQVIVVAAHYDHVGYGNRSNSYGPFGYIHNGADDNASGVAGVLEVIDAFATLPQAPKRSVLFALWDGEEEGLLGSKYWLNNPTLPIGQVVMMFNVDMIGRLRALRVEVYGSRTAAGLRRIASRQNLANLHLNFTWEMKADSDHYPFFERRIPILMLHTGLHNDYHRPSDDADKVNVDGLRTVSQLLFNLVFDLAQADQAPRFRPASLRESPATQVSSEYTLPQPPTRLGIRWDEKSAGDGVRIVEVYSSSPAAQAGLQAGDRIVAFDGHKVGSAKQLCAVVLGVEKSAQVQVVRAPATEPIPLQVQLVGKPIRVGINWRVDEAEPQGVVLTRVVSGSPADRAGLKVQDRIYEVGGVEFSSGTQFDELIAKSPAPLPLLVERNGRLRSVSVDLGLPEDSELPH